MKRYVGASASEKLRYRFRGAAEVGSEDLKLFKIATTQTWKECVGRTSLPKRKSCCATLIHQPTYAERHPAFTEAMRESGWGGKVSLNKEEKQLNNPISTKRVSRKYGGSTAQPSSSLTDENARCVV